MRRSEIAPTQSLLDVYAAVSVLIFEQTSDKELQKEASLVFRKSS